MHSSKELSIVALELERVDRRFYGLYSNRSFFNVEFDSPAPLERPFLLSNRHAVDCPNRAMAPESRQVVFVGRHLQRSLPE
jgi:hypothetical protein